MEVKKRTLTRAPMNKLSSRESYELRKFLDSDRDFCVKNPRSKIAKRCSSQLNMRITPSNVEVAMRDLGIEKEKPKKGNSKWQILERAKRDSDLAQGIDFLCRCVRYIVHDLGIEDDLPWVSSPEAKGNNGVLSKITDVQENMLEQLSRIKQEVASL